MTFIELRLLEALLVAGDQPLPQKVSPVSSADKIRVDSSIPCSKATDEMPAAGPMTLAASPAAIETAANANTRFRFTLKRMDRTGYQQTWQAHPGRQKDSEGK
jgi:hypothetical protein